MRQMNDENKKYAFVGFVVGIVVAWILITGWYMPQQVEQARQEGYNAGYSAGYSAGTASVAGIRAASLETRINNSTFDFSSTVLSDGSVTTGKTINATITIENTDEIAAEDLVITLWNPITNKGGLHEDLEGVQELTIYIVRAGEKIAIYKDGEYVTDGYPYGDLPAGGEITLTFSIKIDPAVAGTFHDGQTYNCKLFIYQSKANYVNTISFTIST